MGSLTGKVALVTGAAAGIGLAVAEAYAREGAGLVFADSKTGAGEAVARVGEAGTEAVFVAADVTDPEQCRRIVVAALPDFAGSTSPATTPASAAKAIRRRSTASKAGRGDRDQSERHVLLHEAPDPGDAAKRRGRRHRQHRVRPRAGRLRHGARVRRGASTA